MTAERQHCYEVLGLDPEAGADEIKRAYFRLVRLHPPEKDPEQFQQIRHAYEILKDAPSDSLQLSFPVPTDPTVLYLIRHAVRHAEAENFRAAADCYDEALKILPDEPFLLLNKTRMQLHAGTPRKAARTAQQLADLCPDYAEAYALAASGLYSGGWYKKAFPEFRKAYKLGFREFDFLYDYADAAEANGATQEANGIRRDLLHTTKWDPSNIDSAIYLFSSIAACCPTREQDLLPLLDEYDRFLTDNRRLLKDFGVELSVPFMIFCSRDPDVLAIPSVYQKMDLLAEAVEKRRSKHDDSDIPNLRGELLITALHADSRFYNTSWADFSLAALTPDEEDTRLHRYGVLDSLLCLLREGEKSLSLLPIIQEEFPFFYEKIQDYRNLLSSPADSEAELQKLRQEYAKLSNQYEGGMFYHRYPEERQLPRGVLAYSDSVPFVRQTKKPGRNDPCPCGSGLKFKRCCLGKGIYD